MGAAGLTCCQGGQGFPGLAGAVEQRNPAPQANQVLANKDGCDELLVGPSTTIDDSAMAEEEDGKRLDAMKGTKRRAGVAAESMSAESMKDYVKPVYAKDAAACEKIMKILKGNEKLQVLFGHLDSSALNDIVNAFRDATATQGQEIITQGAEGDCLYIISEGSVDVFVARPGPDGQIAPGDKGAKVVTLPAGALFGELALMYSAPRAATVVIASPVCKLWQLDREPFKRLLAHQSQTQHALYEGWLSEVEIFKSLNQYELSALSDIMESTLFDQDEVIIKQGDPGDTFYILEDGTAAAYIAGPQGEKKVKEYSRQGEYFGEIALIKEEPRKATVRATGEGCACLAITKEDFTNLLGPITEILRQDIDRYPQYASILK